MIVNISELFAAAARHYQSGEFADAIVLYRRVLEARPDLAEVHSSLGAALKGQGNLDGAAASYRRALALKPDYPNALNNLGNILTLQGKHNDAVDAYRRVLVLNAGNAVAHNNLGVALKDQGKFDEALKSCTRALALEPNYVEAHINIGNILRAQGKLDEAVTSYGQALAAKPDHAEAHNNIALALMDQGKLAEAMTHFRQAIALAPKQIAYRYHYGRLLSRMRVEHCSDSLIEDLVRALDEGWARPIDLLAAVVPILISQANLPPNEARLDINALKSLAASNLFTTFLSQGIAAHRDLELVVARVRRSLLFGLDESRLADTTMLRKMAAATAHQGFNNEYVMFEAPEETAIVETLQSELATQLIGDGPVPEISVLILAAYRPLGRTNLVDSLRRRRWSAALEAVIVRQIVEPEDEMKLRAGIARLTPVDDATSRAVRAQYEENPYPRWTRHYLLPAARPAQVVITGHFPHADVTTLRDVDRTDILVAGCGTGQHPCLTARMYAHSSVLAIDLSLASLSYAVRKARELAISNIEFAQADILALASLDRQFHLIESVGVLHHLREPLKGWSALVGLLRPGGFMKIGLYGEIARSAVVAARNFIHRNDFAPTLPGIRACRKAIFAMAEDEPAKKVIDHPDFYSTSSCRDLLFHVQEHRYLLQDIKIAIDGLGMQFVGFDPIIGSHLARLYARLFPDDPTMTNLDHWQVIEADPHNQLPFVFWVQKPADTSSMIHTED